MAAVEVRRRVSAKSARRWQPRRLAALERGSGRSAARADADRRPAARGPRRRARGRRAATARSRVSSDGRAARRRGRRPGAPGAGSRPRRERRAAPEHEALAERVRGQPVGAVHAGAGALARRRRGRASVERAVEVGHDAADHVVRGRRDRDQIAARVEPDARERFDDVRERARVAPRACRAARSRPRRRAAARRSPRATSSRGASSSTKRSPAPSRSSAPSPRTASVTRKPSISPRDTQRGRVELHELEVGQRRARVVRRAPGPRRSRRAGSWCRRQSAAAPPVASTVARPGSAPASVTTPTQRPSSTHSAQGRAALVHLDQLVRLDQRGQRARSGGGRSRCRRRARRGAGCGRPPATASARHPAHVVELDPAALELAHALGRLLAERLRRRRAASLRGPRAACPRGAARRCRRRRARPPARPGPSSSPTAGAASGKRARRARPARPRPARCRGRRRPRRRPRPARGFRLRAAGTGAVRYPQGGRPYRIQAPNEPLPERSTYITLRRSSTTRAPTRSGPPGSSRSSASSSRADWLGYEREAGAGRATARCWRRCTRRTTWMRSSGSARRAAACSTLDTVASRAARSRPRCTRRAARCAPSTRCSAARRDGRPSARCGRPATTPSPRARWASASSTTSRSRRATRSTRTALERVLVLDWDVHHGNGTNDIFYATDEVLYASIHQSPLYPGTGRARRRAAPATGEGYTVNLPVPGGSGHDEWLGAGAARGRADRARVRGRSCVLVSAGFDAHRDDPLASAC